MPVVRVAVFAAGAALGATAAVLAQRRNDRLTVPVTPWVSTSAIPSGIPRNNEISKIPVVEVSRTGTLGLAQFQGVGSEVWEHSGPGESLHPFICRIELRSFRSFSASNIAGLPRFFKSLRITCLTRV